MSPDRHNRIGELFLVARQMNPDDRKDFLQNACVDDPSLSDEVESLLAADGVETFLVDVATRKRSEINPPFDHDQRLIGTRIGRYTIRKLIGSGGMGTVYEAEQSSPRRVVALKMMRQGFCAPTAIRRFEYECNLLARLRHHAIAQVFDADVYQEIPGGVPYFVMEFVPSATFLTQHIQQRRLPLREQLRLLALVCEGVHHAHQHGVIHRDLKPENILVGPDGLPKIIDFGVARALTTDLQTASMHTTAGHLIGTLPYMSPEQAAGDPDRIDTRTDVYSLGIILYELLTGRFPYKVKGPLTEVLDTIRNKEPVRPRQIQPQLDDEIETIVLKALQKDPARRYQSAGELGRDLERYLGGEPIEAKRDSQWYVLSKLAHRYRVLLGFAAAIVVLITASTIALSFLYAAQKRESRRAEQATALAELRAQEAARKAYVATLSAADHALSIHDAGQVKKYLRQAPAQFRHWEWSYLMSQGDLSYLTLADDEMASKFTFLPDGKNIAVGYVSGRMRVWNVLDGSMQRELPAMTGMVDFMVADTTGSRLFAVERNGSSSSIDLSASNSNQGPVLPISGPYASVTALSNDGTRAIFSTIADSSGFTDHYQIYAYDMVAQRIVQELAGPDPATQVSAAVFAPGGDVIATGDLKGNVALWHWGGSVPKYRVSPEAASRVYGIAIDATGTILATGHEDGTIRLWDAASGGLIRSFAAHAQRVWQVAFDPTGRTVASASLDKTIRLFDVASGRLLSVLHGHEFGVESVIFSPDGSIMASKQYGKGVIKLWRARTRPSPLRVVAPTMINSLSFNSLGREVLTASDDGEVEIWNAETGEVLASFDRTERQVRSAIFGVDESVVIVALWGGRIEFRDLETGAVQRTLDSPVTWPRTLALSSDGRFLACGGARENYDGPSGLIVWDLITGQMRTLEGHQRRLYTIAFHPDGVTLGSAGEENSAWLWDASTGRPILTYSGHTAEGILGLAFSPDGSKVATTGTDGALRIWLTATGQTVRTIEANMLDVWSVAFSPDGLRLVSGARDSTVRIWDASTGDELLVLRGPSGTVRRVAWSSDGRRIAAGTHNREILIWDASSVPGEHPALPMPNSD